jgi:DNA mismatch repair protein MutL
LLSQERRGDDPLLRVAEKVASMSCKAAIKGGQEISLLEAKHLISELMKLENPYHCPHGRPIIVSMTKTDMEKRFKRIV